MIVLSTYSPISNPVMGAAPNRMPFWSAGARGEAMRVPHSAVPPEKARGQDQGQPLHSWAISVDDADRRPRHRGNLVSE